MRSYKHIAPCPICDQPTKACRGHTKEEWAAGRQEGARFTDHPNWRDFIFKVRPMESAFFDLSARARWAAAKSAYFHFPLKGTT